MEDFPPLKDRCINCEQIKQIKTVITLENCSIPFKTGSICFGCYWNYVREALIGIYKNK